MKLLAFFFLSSFLFISEVRAHPAVPVDAKLPSPSLAGLRQLPRAAREFQDAKKLRSSSHISSRAGLTADLCESDSDCLGDRECLAPGISTSRFLPGFVKPCPPSGIVPCVCLPVDPKFCTSDGDCETGEACIVKYFDKKACGSKTAGTVEVSGSAPEPTPSIKSSVCIDARALRHFTPADLVFAEHCMATVLCDKNESCATPGHMVKFRGSTMMMKSYCEKVGCTKREMPVNSPSYRAGLRVSSNTHGLEYTVFAARYESRMEEAAMSAAVRLGL